MDYWFKSSMIGDHMVVEVNNLCIIILRFQSQHEKWQVKKMTCFYEEMNLQPHACFQSKVGFLLCVTEHHHHLAICLIAKKDFLHLLFKINQPSVILWQLHNWVNNPSCMLVSCFQSHEIWWQVKKMTFFYGEMLLTATTNRLFARMQRKTSLLLLSSLCDLVWWLSEENDIVLEGNKPMPPSSPSCCFYPSVTSWQLTQPGWMGK